MYEPSEPPSSACGEVVRRRAAVAAAAAILTLAALTAPVGAAEGDPYADLRIEGSSAPWEGVVHTWLAVFSRRPLAETTDGYSPAVREKGRVLPSRWEEPVELVWDFGDGSGATSTGERPVALHRYEQDGPYTITLEVRTTGGTTVASASKRVEVVNSDPGIRHLAVVTAAGEGGAEGAVELSSQVIDVAGDELVYSWDFGDGERAQGADLWRVTHRYPLAGTYPVRLTVSDGGENPKEKELQVVVSGASGGPAGPAAIEGAAEAVAVVSGLEAEISGGVSSRFEGEIRSLGGVHLGVTSGGACRFMLIAWDPSRLAHVWVILDLAGIPEEGGSYRIERPRVVLNLDPDRAYFERSRQGRVGGLGESLKALGSLTAVLPEAERRRLEDSLGVGLGPGGEAEEAPRSAVAFSPFGLEEHQGFETVGGTLELTFVPRERATATFELTLANASTRPPPGLESMSLSGSFALDLEQARRHGMFYYDLCGSGQLGIERVIPEPDSRHIGGRAPFIGVAFDQRYDPATVTPETFQVGYPAAGTGDFAAAPARFVKDRRTVWLVPEAPLLDGVRYLARLKTGAGGVRSATGGELPDEDGSGWRSWQFTTALDFRAVAGGDLSCHLFQSVRDAPLVPGKPAVARVYASWGRHPQVHESADLRRFDARVTVSSGGGLEAGEVVTHHTFVRPDLWESGGVDRAAAKHTANLYGWTPQAGARLPLRLAVEVQREPGGQWHTAYRTSCPGQMWDRSPKLTIDVFLAAVGSWARGNRHANYLPVASEVMRRVETFAWQVFPFSEVEARFRGVLRPQAQNVPSSLCLDAPERCARLCNRACVTQMLLREAAAESSADIVAVLGPLEDWDGGGAVRRIADQHPSVPGVVLMGIDADPDHFDRIVHGLVHEIGHTLWLEHLPYITLDEPRVELMKKKEAAPASGRRDFWWHGIEGFRLERDGSAGWNKSSSEGNQEGSWLTALMVPVTIPYRQTFIARHHYLDVQELVGGERGGRWTAVPPVPGMRLASLGARGLAAAMPAGGAAGTGAVGVTGILAADGRLALLGPLVPERGGGWQPERGELELVLLDSRGEVVGRGEAHLAPLRGGEEGRGFRGAVRWHPDAVRVEVWRGGESLGGRSRGTAPEVELRVPPGAGLSAPFTVSWSAGDPDGDELLVSLAYSADGDGDWQALGVGLEPTGELAVDPAALAVGPAPTLRLVASDGFDRTEHRVALTPP